MHSTVAVVTGGSSGIGRCTAMSLQNAGCKVYEISRHDAGLTGITHITADVSDEAGVITAIDSIVVQEGHIDIVVNCAGFGISGAVEFTAIADAKQQMDVNFFGMVNINQAVLPYMRKAGRGKIINISSVAALAHIPFQAFYSASKAAINSYTSALANEVRPFGITVTAVMPGDIRTGFTDARRKSAAGDEEYNGRISRSVSGMERDERKGMSPEQAGKRIAAIALKQRVKPEYSIGIGYSFLCVLCRILPCGFRNRIVGLLYAR